VTDRGLGLFGRSDFIFRFLSPSLLALSSLSEITLVGHASIINDDVLSVRLTLFFEENPLLFFRFNPAENCMTNGVQSIGVKLNFNNRCSNSGKNSNIFFSLLLKNIAKLSYIARGVVENVSESFFVNVGSIIFRLFQKLLKIFLGVGANLDNCACLYKFRN
jgi:hypothetical protein